VWVDGRKDDSKYGLFLDDDKFKFPDLSSKKGVYFVKMRHLILSLVMFIVYSGMFKCHVYFCIINM
jgi:hypothetical protein